jgi:hypothetical protein
MDYALAKKLKEAGFPQIVRYNDFFFDQTGTLYSISDSDCMDKTTGGWNPNTKSEGTTALSPYVKCPTLSELIEACGGYSEFMLSQRDGQWEASFRLSELHAGAHRYAVGSGSIPEEAVARL